MQKAKRKRSNRRSKKHCISTYGNQPVGLNNKKKTWRYLQVHAVQLLEKKTRSPCCHVQWSERSETAPGRSGYRHRGVHFFLCETDLKIGCWGQKISLSFHHFIDFIMSLNKIIGLVFWCFVFKCIDSFFFNSDHRDPITTIGLELQISAHMITSNSPVERQMVQRMRRWIM